MVVKGRQSSGYYAECVHFDQSRDAVGWGRGDRTLDLILHGRPEAIGVSSVMHSSRLHVLIKLGAHQTQLFTVNACEP